MKIEDIADTSGSRQVPSADPHRLRGYGAVRTDGIDPSCLDQSFAIALVTHAMDRDAAIILGTATNFWLSAIPRLRSYRYLVTKNSPQSKNLSPRNLGEGYRIVTAALDRQHP